MSNPVRTLDPDQDGITHLNIYTRGKTRLGRLITNLSDRSVTHPVHGTFRCAEGLWYYLKTGCVCEDLRALSGFDAKKLGSTLPVVWLDDFHDQFKEGLINKLMTHRDIYDLFIESELPFEHYYFYGNNKVGVTPKVIEPKDVKWLTEFFTQLRAEWKLNPPQ